ncbi:MAG TPA: alcohol dehydrogenase catalytic domain-containing protein, partial [Steroidobacteraceae bacterium]|nr:alcohol dehydrogenase catalytic domain-containing protein [Steroidobacteraceae bacterium]
MRLTAPGAPLELAEVVLAAPREHEVLLGVEACGVCRTDLHVRDGELPGIHCPLTPGHEVVARVLAAGRAVEGFEAGDRVGVPWLGHTCGECGYC